MKEFVCSICGKTYLASKHCSGNIHLCNDCKGKTKHTCIMCGNEFVGSKKQKLCSDKCRKINNILPTLIKYFNFDASCIENFEVFNEVKRIKDKLYNLYWKEHLSSTQICNIYNYPNVGNLTAKVFKYLGIPAKTVKQSSKENYLLGRSPINSSIIYKQQWHTTWNNKEVYLHSGYELDFAKDLDEQRIDYEVEYLRIKYWDSQKEEFRCAIPDFYIPSTNTIIEIKSSYTLDEKNMKDKMKAYLDLGYNFKLICDHKEFTIK